MKPKPLLLFFTIFFASIFQIAAANSYYDSLTEADFFCHGLKFEAADLDSVFVDKQTHLLIEMNTFSFFLPYLQVLKSRPAADHPRLSSVPDTAILRC